MSRKASTTAPPAGVPLSELAGRLGRSEEAVLELLGPFLEAGIVAQQGGRLHVADRHVRAAFATAEPARGAEGEVAA